MTQILTDRQKVVDFRLQWLLSAGYEEKNANKIAKDLDTDWHLAYDLRKQCADEKLCMKVLYGR